MKKFIFSVVFLSLFSSISFAEELIWHKKQKNIELIYALYTENGLWNVSLTTIKPGKLQDLKWRKAFSTEKKAKSFLKKFLTQTEMLHPNGDNYFGQDYAATESQQQVVWKSENQWTWDWEKKYSKWLGENYTKDFYIKNNIPVDCADNATAIRWIYSRIFKLPVGNTLAGTGVVFTNESFKGEWKDLPTNEDWRKDKLFLAALDYILNNTYTHTMFRDGFPMEITQESFLAGIYMIDLQGETGHTRVVSYVSTDTKGGVPIRLLQSGAPRHLQTMSEGPFGANPVKGKDEMLKSRWPIKNGDKWELIPAEKMPHYSLEQFDPHFPGDKKVFTLAVYDRIVPGFDPLKLVTEGIEQFLTRFPARDKYVKDGYEYCKKKGCPEGTKDWEDWSSPLRDQQLLDSFNSIEKIMLIVSEMNQTAKQVWNEGMALKDVPVLEYRATLKQLLFVWRYNLFDSDPNVPPAQRWATGYPDTVKAMTHRIKKLLNERVEKIKNNSCNNCSKDSQEWKDSNTYQIDSKIQRYYLGVIQYCEIFPVSCEWFRQMFREQTWTFGDETLSLPNWLERSQWFNSDPRVANEFRWGKLQELVVPIHGLVGAKTSISTNDILIGTNYEARQLYDLQKRRNIEPPAGFAVEDLEVTQGLAVIANQRTKQIAVLEPRSQKMVTFALSFVPLRMYWFGPKLIVGKKTSTEIFVIKYENDKFSHFTEIETTSEEADRIVSELNQFPPYYDWNSYYTNRPGNIFLVSTEKTKITIYDFIGNGVIKTPVDYVFPKEFPMEYPQFISHASNTHYLISVNIIGKCPETQPDCYNSKHFSYAVEKGTGKTAPRNFKAGTVLPNGKIFAAIPTQKQSDSDVFIATFDDSFQIKERSGTLTRFYMTFESGHLYLSRGTWEGEVFKIKEDSTFEPLFKTSQNFFPKSFFGDVALVGTQNGDGIYDISNKNMVLKAQSLHPADGYLTIRNPMYFGGDSEHHSLYWYSDKSDIPLVTGHAAFLADRQQCGLRLNMRVGGFTEFTEDYAEMDQTLNCNGDRNQSNGVLFYLASGRAYYLPANARVK